MCAETAANSLRHSIDCSAGIIPVDIALMRRRTFTDRVVFVKRCCCCCNNCQNKFIVIFILDLDLSHRLASFFIDGYVDAVDHNIRVLIAKRGDFDKYSIHFQFIDRSPVEYIILRVYNNLRNGQYTQLNSGGSFGHS